MFCLSLAAIAVISCTQQRETIDADYVFENVNVAPMNAEIILANQAVAVHDGNIVAILDQSSAGAINAATRIDGAGRYLMPGLADMHIHIRMDPQAAFNLLLANGVTTVVNMGLGDRNGDVDIDHLQLRADVAAKRMDGPRYLVSGPQLHAKELPTLADVAPTLDHHVAQGYDVIKVHGPLENEIYDALIDGALERGLRTTGHTQQLRPLSDSLRMNSIEHMEEFVYVSRDPAHGQAMAGPLENYLNAYFPHAERMRDPAYRAPIVREVAASGIYINPTIIIYQYIHNYVADDLFAVLQSDERLVYLPKRTRDEYMDPETNEYRTGFAKVLGKPLGGHDALVEHVVHNLEIFSALLYEMHEAGVPILLGTDAFGAVVPGFSVHQELELMVEAGLTPYQALRTGTVNVAAYLDETDNAGTIESGKRADFILVAGNPLTDIGNAAEVSGVFSNGQWRSAADLQSLLAEAKAIADGD